MEKEKNYRVVLEKEDGGEMVMANKEFFYDAKYSAEQTLKSMRHRGVRIDDDKLPIWRDAIVPEDELIVLYSFYDSHQAIEYKTLEEAKEMYKQVGINENGRDELHGKPIFKDFLPPMFDGFRDEDMKYDFMEGYKGKKYLAIRYETSRFYDLNSF